MVSGSLVRSAQDENLHALHLHERWITTGIIEDARNRGLRLVVWTVDEPARLRMLAGLGIDAIITNRPDSARAILEANEAGT
jgi:glycerophosphoryl diester phosphodiesterase